MGKVFTVTNNPIYLARGTPQLIKHCKVTMCMPVCSNTFYFRWNEVPPCDGIHQYALSLIFYNLDLNDNCIYIQVSVVKLMTTHKNNRVKDCNNNRGSLTTDNGCQKNDMDLLDLATIQHCIIETFNAKRCVVVIIFDN